MSGTDEQIAAEPNLLSLYLAQRAALVRFAIARTGSSEEAEDIVQEMYFRVQRSDEAEVRAGVPYLYKMVLNLVIDRKRSHQRSNRRDGAYLESHATTVDAEIVVEAPDPDEAIDAQRRYAALLAAVRELPPQCGRVFRLHKLEGRSHAEVAAELGISRSAIEKHMISALKQLAGRLR